MLRSLTVGTTNTVQKQSKIRLQCDKSDFEGFDQVYMTFMFLVV